MWSSTFLFPMFFFVSMFILFYSSISFSFNWDIFIMEWSMGSFFLVDFLSTYFIMVVTVVSVAVLIYSLNYMSNFTMKKKFILSLSMFIVSMYMLVLSSDMFWIMIGWDGLGLTSLYLIMYFQNWKSFNSAMITFILNRLGDGFILLSLIWALSVGLSKSISFYGSFFFVFLMIGAFSKSAQFPFSAWLPLAMAAPTPVSSLVHSSTLVTAGVYLIIRFYPLFSCWHLELSLYISLITVFLAGISSIGEYDLKKIIALSTLSHVGMMIMFVSCGCIYSALIHLFTHAMFKSLLFMISGMLIHSSNNNQDIRYISINSFDTLTGMSLVVSLFSMVGVPFFSGFLSKESFLLMSTSGVNFKLLFVFLFSASITASYSIRIMVSLFLNKGNLTYLIFHSSSDWGVLFLMSLMAIVGGSFVVSSVEYLSISYSYLFFQMKMGIYLFVFFGVSLGLIFSFFQGNLPYWSIRWSNCMWFIHSFTHFYQSILFEVSYFFWGKGDSKGLLDFMLFSYKNSSKALSSLSFLLFVPSPLFLISFPIFIILPLISIW